MYVCACIVVYVWMYMHYVVCLYVVCAQENKDRRYDQVHHPCLFTIHFVGGRGEAGVGRWVI